MVDYIENISEFVANNKEILISIFALAISIYSLYKSHRINSLEKRTIVMGEIGEAQYHISNIQEIYSGIERIDHLDGLKVHEEIMNDKNTLDSPRNDLSTIYDDINSTENISSSRLEQIRPAIQKIIRQTIAIEKRALAMKELSRKVNAKLRK